MGTVLPEGYKDSPIGHIPNEWETVPISKFICGLISGTSVNADNRVKEGTEKGILKTSAIFGGKFYEEEHKAVLANEEARLKAPVEADRIIISRMNTPNLVGESGYVSTNHSDLFLPDRLWMTEHSATKHCVKWLSYCLQTPAIKQAIQASASGTSNSMKNISKESFLSTLVPLTPYPEQKKIARILSTVDSKLALIDQQITATQSLKKGLMQKLFSEGVGTQDADGNWQPHTEFKDSELGRIPAGWKVTLLDELANRGSGHTPDKQIPEYWNGRIKWISLADSNKLDQGSINTTDKEISLLGIDNSSAVLHTAGTVVLSRDAGIGKSAVMGEDMAVSQHFIAWNCEPKKRLNNWFLYYLLQLMKPEFERIAIGSTIKTIGLPYFKKLKIAHPTSMDEQDEIAKILSTADRKLEHLTSQKTQTEQLKKGLMQKLLTGQIRVKPDPQGYSAEAV